MSAKGYTTKTKVETFLGKTITASLDDLILAVEKLIDDYTGRNFKADATAVARLYDGNGSQELIIDDCVEVTKVEIGLDCYGDNFVEVAKTGTNRYYTLPANNAALGVPIRKIHLREQSFIEGMQNHRVTAKFGFSAAVAADIAFVATLLVAGMYNYGQNGQAGGVKSESLGNYSVSFETEAQWSEMERAKTILDSNRKLLI